MDYTVKCAIFQYNENKKEKETLLEQFDTTAGLLLEGCTMLEPVLEAGNKVKSMFQKFKDFIMKIYDSFIKTITEIFRNDEKWLSENKNILLAADYSKISMEMIPFKNVVSNEQLLIQTLNKFRADMQSNKKIESLKERSDVEEYYFKYLIDSTGDLANGAKNYYRVGNANGPIKHVKYEGNMLKSKVGEMVTFCETYESKVVKNLENTKNRAFSLLQSVESVLSKRAETEGVKESLFLPNSNMAIYEETILEARNKDKDKKPSPTSVYVDDTEAAKKAEKEKANKIIEDSKKKTEDDKGKTDTQDDKGKVKEKSQEEKDKETYINKKASTDELKILQHVLNIVQVVLAAQLTVAEERYKASMNALSSLARTTRKGDKIEDSKVTKK